VSNCSEEARFFSTGRVPRGVVRFSLASRATSFRRKKKLRRWSLDASAWSRSAMVGDAPAGRPARRGRGCRV
jgi:hypothetical protein